MHNKSISTQEKVEVVKQAVYRALKHTNSLTKLALLGKHKRYLENDEQIMLDSLANKLENNLQKIFKDCKFHVSHMGRRL